MGKKEANREDSFTLLCQDSHSCVSSYIIYSFPLLIDKMREIASLSNRFYLSELPRNGSFFVAAEKNQVQSILCGNVVKEMTRKTQDESCWFIKKELSTSNCLVIEVKYSKLLLCLYFMISAVISKHSKKKNRKIRSFRLRSLFFISSLDFYKLGFSYKTFFILPWNQLMWGSKENCRIILSIVIFSLR